MRLILFAAWIAAAIDSPAGAINIVLDYSYDTTDFFGAGNPSGAVAGQQAKDGLMAAASFFSSILNDTFSPIQTPPPLVSQVGTGTWTWQWTQEFDHPSTGADVIVTDPTVAADAYIVYVGARSLSGSTAGEGGPGGFTWDSFPDGTFSLEEIDQGEATTDAFELAVERRGEPNGFARWGGTVTFDRDGSTVFHYNHQTPPVGNVVDFYSVAVHELAHAVGFGASTNFSSLISSGTFVGTNAQAAYGGPVPMAGSGHWAQDTQSVVYGTSTPQEVAMDPNITNGTRKFLTRLDAAALQDIGWEVIPLPSLFGDYNNDHVVNAADYAVWRDKLNQNVTIPNDSTPGTVTQADYAVWRANFGKTLGSGSGDGLMFPFANVPEPASGALALTVCLSFAIGIRWRG